MFPCGIPHGLFHLHTVREGRKVGQCLRLGFACSILWDKSYRLWKGDFCGLQGSATHCGCRVLVGALHHQWTVGKIPSLLPAARRAWKKEKKIKSWFTSAFIDACRRKSAVNTLLEWSRSPAKSLLLYFSSAGIHKSHGLCPCLCRVAALGLFGNRQLKSVADAGRDWRKPKQQIEILVTQVNCNDLLAPLLFITLWIKPLR